MPPSFARLSHSAGRRLFSEGARIRRLRFCVGRFGPYVNEHAVSQAFTVKTEGGARFSEKAAKDELCTWTSTRCVVLAGTK